MMEYWGTLKTRQICAGGPVTPVKESLVWGAHQHRYVLLFIHGFNNDQGDAEASYVRFLNGLRQLPIGAWLDKPAVGHFFWPGDSRWGKLWGAAVYGTQIKTARESAIMLFEHLAATFGGPGRPTTLSMVAHSLGCRVVVELLSLLATQAPSWHVDMVCLMAAAVPVELVDVTSPLYAGIALGRRLKPLLILHSPNDSVLQVAFRLGQMEAYWPLGLEDAWYPRAVGTYGLPDGLTQAQFRINLGGGHSDYWPSSQAAERVAISLGVTTIRPQVPYRVSAAQAPLLPARQLSDLVRPLPIRLVGASLE